jgi:hypothetical protein
MASFMCRHGFWCGWRARPFPGFFSGKWISTYLPRGKTAGFDGAPLALLIWSNSGFFSVVWRICASTLSEKQTASEHYVESEQTASLSCWLLAGAPTE